MGCLYCGKEIGPFRVLRDSEFCTTRHREKYRDRLGRVLDLMGAAQPAPAGIAGFRIHFPVQEGPRLQVSAPLMAGVASLPGQPDSPHSFATPVGEAFLTSSQTPPRCSASVPLSAGAAPGCALPHISDIFEPAVTAHAPGIEAVCVLRTFMGAVVDEPAFLAGPEPALVDVYPVMDSRPALRSAVPAPLRFALHAVDDPVPAGRLRPVPELRPSGLAPVRRGQAPVAAESMPAFPAYVPAALAPAPAVRRPEFGPDFGIAVALRDVPLPAGAVAGPRPIAVESMPVVRRAIPISLPTPVPLRLPALSHFQPAQEPSDALAAPALAPGPAVVEALPVADAFAALPLAPALVLMRQPLETGAPMQPAAGFRTADFHEVAAPPAPPDQAWPS